MGLEANVGLTIVAHESATEALADVFRVTSVNYAQSFTDGTGANQAQVCWGITATCGTSAVQYDMASLPSASGGVTVTATKVCYVRNLSSDKHIVLGGLSSLNVPPPYNVFPTLSSMTVREDGVFLSTAGDEVGFDNTSARIAAIQTTAGTAAFQFIIIGEGAAP
jgi:hypothetical protein